MLTLRSLSASTQGKEILKGVSLSIQPNEIHALMGPNGAGKSTLANVLAGHPAYEIQGGEALFKGKDLLAMAPEERAAQGLFMSFQYPPEIPGVSNRYFLRTALNAQKKARGEEPLSESDFDHLLDQTMARMAMRKEFTERSINDGFSGGEKKRNEILQMALFAPDLAILDETDSGLDIDALKLVADNLRTFRKQGGSLLIITHYQRLLDFLKPDVVHVLINGVIQRSGGPELALELEANGYGS